MRFFLTIDEWQLYNTYESESDIDNYVDHGSEIDNALNKNENDNGKNYESCLKGTRKKIFQNGWKNK